MQPAERQVLTVTRLTQRLRWTLQERFRDLWVSGEVSNLTIARSGHIYLALNDGNAQIRGVIWRLDAEQIGFELADGMEVLCRGEIDIYPPRGTYQLVIRSIEPMGLGAQQLALKKLHARLEAEGLFASDRKRRLPRFPHRIAVVTSPAGAAIQDFLKVVSRRWPGLEVLVIPARVQGDGAALELARGVQLAGLLVPEPDVVVVTRGGGSAEDLWAFNDERLVRTIAACPLPVVSGVGHEIDVTLCDLVADVRALTPSEAAELVVPLRREVAEGLAVLQQRMGGSLRAAVQRAAQRVEALGSRRALAAPADLLAVASRRVDECGERLDVAVRRGMEHNRQNLASMTGRLQAISPLNVLARGYSVTQTASGETVRNVSEIQQDQLLVTQLAEGRFESRVTRLGSL